MSPLSLSETYEGLKLVGIATVIAALLCTAGGGMFAGSSGAFAGLLLSIGISGMVLLPLFVLRGVVIDGWEKIHEWKTIRTRIEDRRRGSLSLDSADRGQLSELPKD